MNDDPGIRKAAILVAALDRQSADVLLEKMGATQARLVRRCVLELGEIAAEEERRVIDEFVRAGAKLKAPSLPNAASHRRPPGKTAGPEASQEAQAAPFRFLQQAESDKLAGILATERPQTIALVLSHLPARRAGAVLVRLQPPLQVEVIRRLVDLEETDQEILREVEQAIETRLSELVRMQRRRVAGLSAVAGILAASEEGVGKQILGNLNVHDRHLAERLQPSRIDFEDLARLDDRSLAVLFSECDPKLAILALVGAPPDLIERLLRRLPEPEAQAVRQRLVNIGPTRLRDMEQAQSELLELVRQLAAQGRLRLPRSAGARSAEAADVYETAAA